MHLGPEPAHLTAFVAGLEAAGLVVEGFDLFSDGEVLPGAVGDPGV